MNYKMLLIIILSGLAVLFIIQNVSVVRYILIMATQMPRSLLMFLLLAVGMMIGWFLHGYIKHHKGNSK